MKFSYLEPVKVMAHGLQRFGLVLTHREDIRTIRLLRFDVYIGCVVHDVVDESDVCKMSDSEMLSFIDSIGRLEILELFLSVIYTIRQDSYQVKTKAQKELPPWGADWNNDNWGDKAE